MLSHRFYLVTVICAARSKVQEILRFAYGMLVCVFCVFSEKLFFYP